jgi:hypothetical protein
LFCIEVESETIKGFADLGVSESTKDFLFAKVASLFALQLEATNTEKTIIIVIIFFITSKLEFVLFR